MIEKLKKILEKVNADYADLRYEKVNIGEVSVNGKEIASFSNNSTDGYVLRVLKDGGFSSITFTKAEDADIAIQKATENAIILSKTQDKKTVLAPCEVIKDSYKPELDEDPRDISLEEKLKIVQEYLEIPLNTEGIATANLAYSDKIREKYFVNTEGTEIFEELVTTRLLGSVISKKGDLTQNVRIGTGGSQGFGVIRNNEEMIKERTKIALDLLDAEPVAGGTYNVILNPGLTGVFTHEAFGHFSEADLIENSPSLREKMQIGAKLGNDIVNITDDATMANQLGFYKYDDEGVAVRKVELMKNGVLTGRLHSRQTAGEFGEPISGHHIAEDYRYAPIIRMGNIFIEPGQDSFEDLVAKLGDGLYLVDAMGGQTSGENFTFGAQYGYKVENGKIAGMIRDINIAGNLFMTLKNIVAIGNDFVLKKVGGCGKGQTNIRSCHGGPHILVNDVVIGGR